MAGISLRNVLIAAVGFATWAMILNSVGMYSARRSRTLGEYGLRCLIGLNCCIAVVGLVQWVLQPAFDVWRFAAIYWFLCLVGMTVLRLMLLLSFHALLPMDQRQ